MNKISAVLGGVCTALLSLSAHAYNPVNGWYAGANAGIAFAPEVNGTFSTQDNFIPGVGIANAPVNIEYKVSGIGGIAIGYRNGKVRMEGETFYTAATYDTMTVAGVTFPLTFKGGPCASNGCSMHNATGLVGGVFNVYYDFVSDNVVDTTTWAPYLGIGAGYGYVYNDIKFTNYDTGNILANYSKGEDTFVYQLIAGFNYYLDDYTAIGMDYRYIRSGKVGLYDAPFTNHTINFTVFFVLDKEYWSGSS